jgi:multiple sugar transport system ATP-binding protein
MLGIRPEAFDDAAFSQQHLPRIPVTIDVLEELGSDSHVIFAIDAPRVEAEELKAAADNEEEALIAGDHAVWNARVQSKTAARVGERIRLAMDASHLYFFDPDNGASLTAGARSAAAVA